MHKNSTHAPLNITFDYNNYHILIGLIMLLWALLQKVLSELLCRSLLCIVGFDLVPLLSLSLSAAGTKWAVAAALANPLQTHSRHFLVFIDQWHLIGLRGAQMPPSFPSTLCISEMADTFMFIICICMWFYSNFAHFLSGSADKIKLNDPPRRDWVITAGEKKKKDTQRQ